MERSQLFKEAPFVLKLWFILFSIVKFLELLCVSWSEFIITETSL